MIVEIRAAEGGDDAKALVGAQLAVYRALAVRRRASLEVIEVLPGRVTCRVDGLDELLLQEAGGHRWQRVPPNEKRGRVHTSTVTVAVLPEPTERELALPAKGLRIVAVRGSGPGGQHRNKTATCVVVTHLATGLSVRCEETKSQHRNRELAVALLRSRLWDAQHEKTVAVTARRRREQVGSGMRGDKRRTVREQDGRVTDQDGRTWRLRDYLRGDW